MKKRIVVQYIVSPARVRSGQRVWMLAILAILAIGLGAPAPAAADGPSQGKLDHWAYRSIEAPAPPTVRDSGWVRGPVDRFILARLETESLRPAGPASRRVLIRRVYFDLIGLPPTYDEVEAFARDPDPMAYDKLIDRLLSSKHHGERWGRHWLDVVRYAETNGYERDSVKPGAWKYRDYVVNSLNSDKPFDRFVLEQLAGDEIPERSEESVIATGFLRLGTWDDEPNEPGAYRYERIEDLVHTTSSAFLGLTVKCARCHDHKFDPIPTSEYYGFASAFWAGFIEPRDRKLQGGPTSAELGFDVLGWTDRGREVPSLKILEKGDPERPGEVARPGALSLVSNVEPLFASPAAEASTTQRRLQLARWIVDPRNPLTARVVANRIWQHHFGRGLVSTPNNFGTTGGRPSHPRLLDWLATEIVRGDWKLKRIHRLLLLSSTYRMSSSHSGYAACEQVDPRGRWLWRFPRRRLEAEAIRDSLLSVSGELDLRIGGPGFYPIISKQALEGLSRKGASWGTSSAKERARRSLYIFTKRSLLLPFLTRFDVPNPTASCPKRPVTTVPTQALALLNNSFSHARSAAFARRVCSEVGENRRMRIQRAWELGLSRRPTSTESDAALTYLVEQTEYFSGNSKETGPRRPDNSATQASPEPPEFRAFVSLCHTLFNTNEFIHVD